MANVTVIASATTAIELVLDLILRICHLLIRDPRQRHPLPPLGVTARISQRARLAGGR
jgi:hypothetical protein